MSDNIVRLSDYQAEPPAELPDPEALEKGPGGGNSNGMDIWQQSVETRLGQLHDDLGKLNTKLDSRFMWLLGAFAAGFVVLMSLVINRTDALSDRLGGKLDGVSAQIGAISERISKIEGAALPAPAKRP